MAAHQHAPHVERRASPPTGAGGGFVAGTLLARMPNATALFMNVVEGGFCELRLYGVLGSSQNPPVQHLWTSPAESSCLRVLARFLRRTCSVAIDGKIHSLRSSLSTCRNAAENNKYVETRRPRLQDSLRIHRPLVIRQEKTVTQGNREVSYLAGKILQMVLIAAF